MFNPTNIGRATLAHAGYREYTCRDQGVAFATQRKIYRKEDGKLLFFVNLKEYDFTFHNGERYNRQEYSVVLYFENGMAMNATLHSFEGATIERVEEHFVNMFNTLKCLPDIHND